MADLLLPVVVWIGYHPEEDTLVLFVIGLVVGAVFAGWPHPPVDGPTDDV